MDNTEADIHNILKLATILELRATTFQTNKEILVKRGILIRIVRGKYYRHNFKKRIGNQLLLTNDGIIAGTGVAIKKYSCIRREQIKRNT